MRDLAIYGAGGFGREVYCIINAINKVEKKWNFIGFFDDDLSRKGELTSFGKIIGGINDLNALKSQVSIVMSIGKPSLVMKIVREIVNPLIDFPNIISPDIILLDTNSTKFGKGNLIMNQTLISCNVEMGDFNLLNCGISIGHDSRIGSYNSFMSYAKISGQVMIGNCNYFGACSLILQQKKIGYDTIIGANSVIMRDTEDNNTYIGNPANKIVKPKTNT